MHGHIKGKVRAGEIFCRERTPTELHVFGALIYHAGASYRKTAALLDVSHEAIRQWFLKLEPLFQPLCRTRPIVAIDETKINVDRRYVFCWAAVGIQTFEMVHLDVTPGRSSLDALLFLKTVLERCRGTPLVIVDRGPWYNWPLETLGCRFRKETWGTRKPHRVTVLRPEVSTLALLEALSLPQ